MLHPIVTKNLYYFIRPYIPLVDCLFDNCLFFAGFYSAIEPVIGGICCSCVFVSGSSAIGCTLKLYSDEHTLLVFNISRGTNDSVAV